MVERRGRRQSPGNRTYVRSSSHDPGITTRRHVPPSPSSSEGLGSASSLDQSIRSLGSRGSLCDEGADDCDSINVVVRCRPVSEKEKRKADDSIVSFPGEGQIWVNVDGINGQAMQKPKVFTYNVVFEPEAIQEDIVEHSGVKRLLDMALDGFCCTVFCYGQTGSGKTHTLTGPPYLNLYESGESFFKFDDENNLYSEDHGLIFRSFVYLFNQLQNHPEQEFTIKASYLEIYNEKVIDLLNIGTNNRHLQVRWSKKQRGFFVENLFSIECAELDDLLAVLEEGLRNRAVASHNMNEYSSRSHTILTVYITSEQKADDGVYITKNGKINFVDLAGSEMTKKTNSEGKTLEEANNINKSLMVLGTCISALSDPRKRDGHIPYRDSKLTKLLADSLAGSGVTLMIACVSPARSNLSETLNTLRYAARAKRIRTKPIVIMDPKEKVIMSLQSEVKLLQEENAHLKMLLDLGTIHNNGMPNGSVNGNEIGLPNNLAVATQVDNVGGIEGSLSRQGSFQIDKEKLDQMDNRELINLLTHYMSEHDNVRKENKELQKVTSTLVRDQELVSKENERLLKKLEDVSRSGSHPPESSQVWINPNDDQGRSKNGVESAPAVPGHGRKNSKHRLPESISKELEKRRIGKSMNDLTITGINSRNNSSEGGRSNSWDDRQSKKSTTKSMAAGGASNRQSRPKPKRSQSVPRPARKSEANKTSKIAGPRRSPATGRRTS